MGACTSKDGVQETQKKSKDGGVLEAPKPKAKAAAADSAATTAAAEAKPSEAPAAEAGTGEAAVEQDPKKANSQDAIEPPAALEAPAAVEGEEPRPATAPVADAQAAGEDSGKALGM